MFVSVCASPVADNCDILNGNRVHRVSLVIFLFNLADETAFKIKMPL